MKGIWSFIIAFVMFCMAVSSVSADEIHTYDADNLNNNPDDLIIGFIVG